MNSQICKHQQIEEVYICLEDNCLLSSGYKLNCLKCLQQIHPHHECIMHIEDILLEAEENQTTFNLNIDQYIACCLKLKKKLESDVQEMRTKINFWIDYQAKIILEQIEQYQFSLSEHQQQISFVQFSEDDLKNVIRLRNYDNQSFMQQNNKILNLLEFNEDELKFQCIKFFDRINENYLPKVLTPEQFPQILSNKVSQKNNICFEKCSQKGCCMIEKNMLCLEKNCLLKNDSFQCPMCQTMKHLSQNKQNHKQYFISADNLWFEQNKLIDKAHKFCENKVIEVKETIKNLQLMIIEEQKIYEQHLQKFQIDALAQEEKIIYQLEKFQGQFQKGQNLVYKDLFLYQDLSMIAKNFTQLDEDLEKRINQFTANFISIQNSQIITKKSKKQTNSLIVQSSKNSIQNDQMGNWSKLSSVIPGFVVGIGFSYVILMISYNVWLLTL